MVDSSLFDLATLCNKQGIAEEDVHKFVKGYNDYISNIFDENTCKVELIREGVEMFVNLDSSIFINYIYQGCFYHKDTMQLYFVRICKEVANEHNAHLIRQERWNEILSGGMI